MPKPLLTPIQPSKNDRSIRWAKLVVLSALLGDVIDLAATTHGGSLGIEAIVVILVRAIVKI